jgi:MoaA/NifB/PqqE/SkfB family radical SAM enzyme
MTTQCPLPWINLNATSEGDCRPCWHMLKPQSVIMSGIDPEAWQMNDQRAMNWSADTLDDIWNGEHMQRLRTQMLAGRRPMQCHVCYKKENLAENSPRLTAIEQYGLPFDAAPIAPLPLHLQIKMDRNCNLRCTICNVEDSNRVEMERQEAIRLDSLPYGDEDQLAAPVWLRESYAKEHKTRRKLEFESAQVKPDLGKRLSNFARLAPTLQSISITGGEPLLDPDLTEYLKMLKAADNTSCSIELSTNCTVWNSDLAQQLRDFENVRVYLSIDAHGDANTWIRYDSQWHDITSNLDNWLQCGIRGNIVVYSVISAVNAHSIPTLLDWLRDVTFRNQRPLIWTPTLLTRPDYQQLKALPLRARQQLANLLDKRDLESDDEYPFFYREGLRMVISNLRDPDEIEPKLGRVRLREWLNYTQQLRNNKLLRDTLGHGWQGHWQDVFPKLYEIIGN